MIKSFCYSKIYLITFKYNFNKEEINVQKTFIFNYPFLVFLFLYDMVINGMVPLASDMVAHQPIRSVDKVN